LLSFNYNINFYNFKTPNFDEIDFSSTRNDAASGGFGPNQVSTALGFGSLLMFLFVFNKWNFSGKKWLDYLLLFGFTFQGLLTFSRGGMFGTLVAILVLIFLLKNTSYEDKIKYNIPNIGKFVLPAIFAIIISYQVADYATGGWLSLRYQGETKGTLAGTKKKDFNHYTTGRADIFDSDIDLWMDNFILGVGAGSSTYMRERHRGTLTHSEVSRLLAEHGVLGLGYLVCLLVVGYRVFKSKQNPLYKSILIAFFVLAIYTTFHAAMRTFITPLLIGLSTISIVDFKRKNEPQQVVSKQYKI
jgi:O-antigen ligase